MNTRAEISILIIDDDEDDFIITEQMIRDIPNGEFRIDWCARYDEGLEQICRKSYDIYFIDYFLGGITGMELLSKSIECNNHSPLILLTGKGNRDIALKALETGAADYLVKSELTTEKLERCIRYTLEKAFTLKKLRDNENKFRSIFEKTRDSIFLSDMDLNIVDANAAMATMFSFSNSELVGMSVYDMMADEENVRKVQQALQYAGEVTDLEMGFHDRSGEELTCIFSAVAIARPEGPPYVQGILHDITKLKRTERSLLMSEKLAATGRLARTLAHEIRNPLTNINLALDHLVELSMDEEVKSYLDIIQRNSKRVNDILTELLASSKPAQATMKEYVFQEILDESVNAAMDRILLKNIKVQVRYFQQPVVIMADKDRLIMAFLNIIINAVEAMSSENGKLMVVLGDGGKYWEVRITDNGVGIAEEDLPRLFEPYFTAKRNGMGLGLSAALNSLQAHQAIVEVNSVPHIGTTFSIQFPKYDRLGAA